MSNKFDNFYSKKPVSELIHKLLDHKVHGLSMDPTWYDALIIHLSKRDMTDDQRKEIDHILTSDAATLKRGSVQYESAPESMMSAKVGHVTSGKYPALQMLSGIIATVAWIIAGLTVVIVLALFNNLHGEGSWIFPIGTFAIGAIFSIALFAYSEVIKVFIDIEENTRRTSAK
jgi:hypothetical protein